MDLEKRLAAGCSDENIILAKTYGFTNTEIAALTGKDMVAIEEMVGAPVYKMVDTCAAEFPASTLIFTRPGILQARLSRTTGRKGTDSRVGTDTDRPGNRIRLLHGYMR